MLEVIILIFLALLTIIFVASFIYVALKEKSLIKTIFSDVLFMYKNFLHWNISKLLIGILVGLFSLLLIIPFVLISFLFMYFSSINWSSVLSSLSSGTITSTTIADLLASPVSLVLTSIVLLISIVAFIFFISYYRVLLVNLNLKYIDRERLGYKQNEYFNLIKIWKFFQIVGWMALYLLVPVSIALVLFIILLVLFGGIGNINSILANGGVNLFSVLTLIISIITVVIVLYLSYRMSFSYIILSDEEEIKPAKYYVKKSIELTKGFYVFVKFIVVSLVFFIPILPFQSISTSLENTNKDIYDYASKKIQNGTGYVADDYDYQNLDLKYGKYSDSELEAIYEKNNNYNTVLYIFSFLFIYGLIEMVRVSFYRNDLLLENKNIFFKEFTIFKNYLNRVFRRKKKEEL